MNYTGPKIKVSRRLGVTITPKAKKYLELRPDPPGMHGKRRKMAKLSDYGRQLLEKQRLRFQYNISEKQLHNYYLKAIKKKGNTADILIQLLESRLDALTLRTGFARTIYAARQLIGHGHVEVNGKKVDIPSRLLKPGDKISIKQKSQKIDAIKFALDDASPPEYMKLDKEAFSAELLNVPDREKIPVVCEVSLVVEFYSR